MYEIDFNRPIHVYFIGIGGVSMSGLAEILLTEHFTISGSDRLSSALTEELSSKGARIYYGQREENITSDIDLVVYTSAITEDNPEYKAMKAMKLPSLTRAELLGQMMKNYKIPIAVSGTHGKTTTTSMISEILLAHNIDPTLSLGGILPSIHDNYRVGASEYFVTEACEYTNSFLSFFPKIGIILNIEEDHLDFFKDLDDIRHSFRKFAELLPEDGALIINGDITDLHEITDGLACRIITFGTGSSCDYSAADICFDEHAHPTFTLIKNGKITDRTFTLGVVGEHNVYNALSAIALSDVLMLSEETCRSALQSFSGSERRFEYKGIISGITIIDDYAHHPTEIAATLQAAANYPHNTLWCIFQPHTFTRTKAFLKEFAEALAHSDRIILADIYAAREKDDLGISSKTLQHEIQALGGDCYYFHSFEEIQNFVLENCTKGDLLITMGAGDVYKIGENLLKQ